VSSNLAGSASLDFAFAGTIPGCGSFLGEEPPMPVREGPPPPKEPPSHPADKVRGGEIILRARMRRIIFIAGLAGAAVLALVLEYVA
jgi:hypothetical protein